MRKKLFLSSLGPHFDTKMMLNVVVAPPASQNVRPCVTELDPTGRPGGGRGAEGLLFNILGRLLGSPSVANLYFYDIEMMCFHVIERFACTRARFRGLRVTELPKERKNLKMMTSRIRLPSHEKWALGSLGAALGAPKGPQRASKKGCKN